MLSKAAQSVFLHVIIDMRCERGQPHDFVTPRIGHIMPSFQSMFVFSVQYFSIGFWRCGVSRFRALAWLYVCMSGLIHDILILSYWFQWLVSVAQRSSYVHLGSNFVPRRTSYVGFHFIYPMNQDLEQSCFLGRTLLSLSITLDWISIISVELRPRVFTHYASVVLCSYHRLNHAFVSHIIVRCSYQWFCAINCQWANNVIVVKYWLNFVVTCQFIFYMTLYEHLFHGHGTTVVIFLCMTYPSHQWRINRYHHDKHVIFHDRPTRHTCSHPPKLRHMSQTNVKGCASVRTHFNYIIFVNVIKFYHRLGHRVARVRVEHLDSKCAYITSK